VRESCLSAVQSAVPVGSSPDESGSRASGTGASGGRCQRSKPSPAEAIANADGGRLATGLRRRTMPWNAHSSAGAMSSKGWSRKTRVPHSPLGLLAQVGLCTARVFSNMPPT
jgi:hypothetical protein